MSGTAKNALMHHVNRTPDPVFHSLDALRAEMTRLNPEGDAFLDFLLHGDYFEGKGVWVNQRAEVRSFYDKMLAATPHLASESPFGSWFRCKGVRTQGENRVLLRRMSDAPPDHHTKMHEHLRLRASGSVPSSAVFVGGAAAQVAAIGPVSNHGPKQGGPYSPYRHEADAFCGDWQD